MCPVAGYMAPVGAATIPFPFGAAHEIVMSGAVRILDAQALAQSIADAAISDISHSAAAPPAAPAPASMPAGPPEVPPVEDGDPGDDGKISKSQAKRLRKKKREGKA